MDIRLILVSVVGSLLLLGVAALVNRLFPNRGDTRDSDERRRHERRWVRQARERRRTALGFVARADQAAAEDDGLDDTISEGPATRALPRPMLVGTALGPV